MAYDIEVKPISFNNIKATIFPRAKAKAPKKYVVLYSGSSAKIAYAMGRKVGFLRKIASLVLDTGQMRQNRLFT